jgi:hypothetical protein
VRSADISHDHETNAPYFTVRVALSGEERRRLAGLQLIPGYACGGLHVNRQSYLLNPITDQMRRAFVEQWRLSPSGILAYVPKSHGADSEPTDAFQKQDA